VRPSDAFSAGRAALPPVLAFAGIVAARLALLDEPAKTAPRPPALCRLVYSDYRKSVERSAKRGGSSR